MTINRREAGKLAAAASLGIGAWPAAAAPVPARVIPRRFDPTRHRFPAAILQDVPLHDPEVVRHAPLEEDPDPLIADWVSHRWGRFRGGCAPLVVVGTIEEHVEWLRRGLLESAARAAGAAGTAGMELLTPPVGEEDKYGGLRLVWGGHVPCARPPGDELDEPPFDPERHKFVSLVGGTLSCVDWRAFLHARPCPSPGWSDSRLPGSMWLSFPDREPTSRPCDEQELASLRRRPIQVVGNLQLGTVEQHVRMFREGVWKAAQVMFDPNCILHEQLMVMLGDIQAAGIGEGGAVAHYFSESRHAWTLPGLPGEVG